MRFVPEDGGAVASLLVLGVALRWTSIPFQLGKVEILISHFMLLKLEISAGLMGMQTLLLPYVSGGLISLFDQFSQAYCHADLAYHW